MKVTGMNMNTAANSSGGTGMSSINMDSNKSFNEHGHWE